MKFVMFVHPTHEGATTIAINPAHVHAVVAAIGPNGRDSRVSALLTSHASDEGIGVAGSVAEVVAALESATAPPVAAAVEVAPTDLEMAAQVLDVVASEIDDQELEGLAARINNKIGTRYDVTRFDGAIPRLIALAAKLRGGGR